MDEIMKELDAVFRLISSVPVTGESVDIMAAARSKLRKAYNDIDRIEKARNEVAKHE